MGEVAIFYFFAASFALATACAGRDVRAKFVAAYLLGTWMISNDIFLNNPPAKTLEMFSFIDVLAVFTLTIVLIRWPSRWLAVIIGALALQVLLQLEHRFDPFGTTSTWVAFLRNEALYALMLATVCTPTIAPLIRRRRKPKSRRVEIAPPYEGWKPPADYR